MTRPPESLLQCPTRTDGAAVLIAQTVFPSTCQSRQRRLYHKCWTCAHRHGVAPRVAALEPETSVPVIDLKPVSTPVAAEAV